MSAPRRLIPERSQSGVGVLGLGGEVSGGLGLKGEMASAEGCVTREDEAFNIPSSSTY